ncbi:hypothetical protein Acsp03_57780 [Actinomadura sp. NBRC 104412]|nr:hypothetical protein Acsp03_57780 [Actinomadura sp. NBRC 104412]
MCPDDREEGFAVTAPLTTTSPVTAGRDRIEDKQGRTLAFVRWSETPAHQRWLRRAALRSQAKKFELVEPDGTVLCRAVEGSLRPGKEPSKVLRADGTEIGSITVVRLSARNLGYVLWDAAGERLAEGRFVTKVKYGDVPKKLTHAFEDAGGRRLATADRKPAGGPQRIGFDGRASEDLRLLVICLMIMLPNAEIGGDPGRRPPRLEPEDFTETRPGADGGPFTGSRLVFHRDRLSGPDGRVLATVREPSVAPHRGLSRALSAHPQGGRYEFEVAGPAGETLFTIEKSSGAFRYEVVVSLPDGGRLGTIDRTGGPARAVHTISAGPGDTLATVTATGAFGGDFAVTVPGGAQVAAVSRVQAVDEPWEIGLSGGCDERLRMLLVAFVVVQELMLDL